MPGDEWQPLTKLWSSPGARRAATELIAGCEAAGSGGGYRTAGLEAAQGSLWAWCELDRVVGLAGSRLDRNDDPEIAAAAGDVAITLPAFVLKHDAESAGQAVESLIRQLREEHGDHRITVHQPVGIAAETASVLRDAGFRADSALSVRPTAIVGSQATAAVEPVADDDADEVANLFRQSLKTLSALSPFVAYREDAVAAVHARVRTSRDGVTAEDTRVGVVRAADGRLVGVVETSLNDLPEPGLVAWLPAGALVGIDWIAVTGDARRRGVGRSLADWATLWPDGVQRLSYSYHLLGEGSAARFWSRLGYAQRWTTYELAEGGR